MSLSFAGESLRSFVFAMLRMLLCSPRSKFLLPLFALIEGVEVQHKASGDEKLDGIMSSLMQIKTAKKFIG